MFRGILKFLTAMIGLVLDLAITLFVIGAVFVVALVFLFLPSLVIPHRKPSEGFGVQHAH